MTPLGSEPHLTFVRWLLVWFWQKGSITERTTDNRQRETCPFLSTGHPITLHSATAHHLGSCKWDSAFLYLFTPTKLASLYPSEIPEDCPAPSPQQCGSQLCDTSLPKTSSNHFLVSLLCCWVQLLSCLTLCDPMNWSTEGPLSSTISKSLLKLMFMSWWCHPTIPSSVIPFYSWLQSFPASGSFPVSQFFASGGQSIGASASVLPKNIQDQFLLELTGLILQSKGLSRVFSSTTVKKH